MCCCSSDICPRRPLCAGFGYPRLVLINTVRCLPNDVSLSEIRIEHEKSREREREKDRRCIVLPAKRIGMTFHSVDRLASTSMEIRANRKSKIKLTFDRNSKDASRVSGGSVVVVAFRRVRLDQERERDALLLRDDEHETQSIANERDGTSVARGHSISGKTMTSRRPPIKTSPTRVTAGDAPGRIHPSLERAFYRVTALSRLLYFVTAARPPSPPSPPLLSPPSDFFTAQVQRADFRENRRLYYRGRSRFARYLAVSSVSFFERRVIHFSCKKDSGGGEILFYTPGGATSGRTSTSSEEDRDPLSPSVAYLTFHRVHNGFLSPWDPTWLRDERLATAMVANIDLTWRRHLSS